jgi:hypothetical protein
MPEKIVSSSFRMRDADSEAIASTLKSVRHSAERAARVSAAEPATGPDIIVDVNGPAREIIPIIHRGDGLASPNLPSSAGWG